MEFIKVLVELALISALYLFVYFLGMARGIKIGVSETLDRVKQDMDSWKSSKNDL